MNKYGFSNCPANVKAQISDITNHLTTTFSSCLVGVYLHGSLVLNCFNPQNSDIDILAVIDDKIGPEKRLDLAKYFTEIHCKPSPVEISIIYSRHLDPWQHPMPCQFHFSGSWKQRYEEMIKNNNLSHWILTTDFTDSDIACHATLTKQSGICLYGKPIAEVFPDVPEEHFWNSITYDVNDIDLNAFESDYFASNILTFCRVWSYKELGRIISKYEAGIWAAGMLPEHLKYIVRYAVADKFEEQRVNKDKYCNKDLDEFKNYVIGKIFDRSRL